MLGFFRNDFYNGDAMIREELNELYWLKKEVEDLQNRLQELDETCGVSSTKIDSEIHASGGKSAPVEELAIKKLQLENQIYEYMILILEEKQKIEKFIETIPDSKLRTIVRLRNIDLMSWEEIGKFMELDRKTVSKKYNEYIKSIRKLMKENKEQREVNRL